MPYHSLRFLWLSITALIAGAINSVAGGGSLLSFPALLQAGVLPKQANATNTMALLPGQFTSAAAYRGQLQRHRSLLLSLIAAAFLGGVIGARLLMATHQRQFLHLVPWLLLVATSLFGLGPSLQKKLTQNAQVHDHATGLRPIARLLLPIGIFIVCLYVGYFGAGAGLLIMSTLSVAGVDSVHEINALKATITSTSNTVAALTFVLYGAVVWRYALLMMITASVGGYVCARIVQRQQPKGMRAFIVILGCMVTAFFFWKVYG